MATEMKRLTFAVTKEMEPLLDRAKKDLFYNRTHSDMIRELVMAGLEILDEKAVKKTDAIERLKYSIHPSFYPFHPKYSISYQAKQQISTV